MNKELNRKIFCVGGGIGSLTAAAFAIRDGGIPGENITIYESLNVNGGALDATSAGERGYSLRGGRMLTLDNYECLWGLLKDIPSYDDPNVSIYDETVAFNKEHPSNAKARLVDDHRKKFSPGDMGFDMRDRLDFNKLINVPEEDIDDRMTINDWFTPHFFKTNFWYMWATTFAFQPWSSLIEFKRYCLRFMLEFTRIENLGGVKRTKYNQYDSIVRPLVKWLLDKGVNFENARDVVDIQTEIEKDTDKVTATSLVILHGAEEEIIELTPDDIVILQNGSMVDSSTLGDMYTAPAKKTKSSSRGWFLWEKLASKYSDFGEPSVFNENIPETYWPSFTVTVHNDAFFDAMEEFTGNEAGTGGLVTFKDSSWFMSIVLAHQPYFVNQAPDTKVFWGYCLNPDRVGDYIAKSHSECTGEEILRELCGHLKFDYEKVFGADAKTQNIPCRMPYIISMFQPRKKEDRPLPVPPSSKNIALVSQFVEIPDDCVFTVEYSVRAAQTAIYQLLDIKREIPKVTDWAGTAKVKLNALIKAFE